MDTALDAGDLASADQDSPRPGGRTGSRNPAASAPPGAAGRATRASSTRRRRFSQTAGRTRTVTREHSGSASTCWSRGTTRSEVGPLLSRYPLSSARSPPGSAPYAGGRRGNTESAKGRTAFASIRRRPAHAIEAARHRCRRRRRGDEGQKARYRLHERSAVHRGQHPDLVAGGAGAGLPQGPSTLKRSAHLRVPLTPRPPWPHPPKESFAALFAAGQERPAPRARGPSHRGRARGGVVRRSARVPPCSWTLDGPTARLHQSARRTSVAPRPTGHEGYGWATDLRDLRVVDTVDDHGVRLAPNPRGRRGCRAQREPRRDNQCPDR